MTKNVLWVGTSISDQHLDVTNLLKNYNVNVDKLKAFTITREDGRIIQKLNAEEMLPKALATKQYDLIVLELGVNEISNIDIKVEPHVMKNKIKNHMEKLFLLAVKAAAD